jgi:hypothetical protein
MLLSVPGRRPLVVEMDRIASRVRSKSVGERGLRYVRRSNSTMCSPHLLDLCVSVSSGHPLAYANSDRRASFPTLRVDSNEGTHLPAESRGAGKMPQQSVYTDSPGALTSQ